MPKILLNGTRIYYQQDGEGSRVLLLFNGTFVRYIVVSPGYEPRLTTNQGRKLVSLSIQDSTHRYITA